MYPVDDPSAVLAGTGVKASDPSALCRRCVASAKYHADTGERLGDRPHVGGDEGVGRQRIAVDVATDRDEVGVVPQLGIVVQAAPGADAVAAPAAWQVGRVGGLRPAEEHVVVACLEPDQGVDPAVRLRVPLDLDIRCGEAGGGSDKTRQVE